VLLSPFLQVFVGQSDELVDGMATTTAVREDIVTDAWAVVEVTILRVRYIVGAADGGSEHIALGAQRLLEALGAVKSAVLLGEQYAENLGVNTRRVRNWLIIVTGLLTAVTTAYCGPIMFIGLAVPHIAHLLFRQADHRILMPGTILCGAVIALLCNAICFLPGESGIIPLNAVTPVMGAPVIIYIIMKGEK
jgi:ABC-type enterochelin transport system permease subunit